LPAIYPSWPRNFHNGVLFLSIKTTLKLAKENLMSSIPSQYRSSSRRGLTLIEIMIALTMTMIVLGAMMQAFQYASGQMQMGRATMEMANRLRSAEELLRSDLKNLTVEPRPYTGVTNPNGYFEIIDGSMRDKSNAAGGNSYLGDVDDVIAMTVRSDGQFFRGRNDPNKDPNNTTSSKVIESSIAEVMWYTTFADRNADQLIDLDESVKIHRRVLLIRPDMGPWLDLTFEQVTALMQNNDISCRIVIDLNDNNYNVYANSLSDLALRRNRFCHQYFIYDNVNPSIDANWPHFLDKSLISGFKPVEGNDIVLTDVASFDLQIYSPDVSLSLDADIPVAPADIGFPKIATQISAGDFVDLVWNSPASPPPNALVDFRGSRFNFAQQAWRNDFPAAEAFYDTWTPVYESDGFDQDNDSLIDEGTNGLDNGGPLAPDDDSERETRPPYPYSIRGVKVSIRLIEKTTNQVYQSSIVHSYVPE
jgi:type II secretory pathway pseudopilin PulG